MVCRFECYACGHADIAAQHRGLGYSTGSCHRRRCASQDLQIRSQCDPRELIADASDTFRSAT